MNLDNSVHKQKGVATLLTAVVILLVMSLMAAYAYRSSLLENQLMNNLYRAKQAEETAEAALDYGLAYFMANGVDATADSVVDTLDPSGVTNGRRATVQFCSSTSNIPTCTAPTNFGQIMIMATGWSDDQTAVHRSRMLVASNPFFGANVKAPLIVKGGTNFLGGNLTVKNNTDSGINVWTGHDIDSATGSFQTQGKVDGLLNQNISEKTGSKYYLGPDIVYNDQTLKNASTDVFYQTVVGRTAKEIQASADVKVATCADLSASDSYAGKIVYVSGNCDLRRNLGSDSASAIVVVGGELTVGSNSEVWGSLIANSLGRFNGTPTVHGSLVSLTADSLNGNAIIDLTDQWKTNLMNVRVKSVVGNSWRDW